MYPKTYFRKRTKCSSIGVENTKLLWGRIPQDPLLLQYIRQHTKLFVTNHHLSSLHTQYGMVSFCRVTILLPQRHILKKGSSSGTFIARFRSKSYSFDVKCGIHMPWGGIICIMLLNTGGYVFSCLLVKF